MHETFDELTAELIDTRSLLANARRTLPVTASYVRDLEPTDLELAATAQGVGVGVTPNLQSLRASHHRIAQLLARGLKDIDISRMTGYSQSRISILKNDPAFKELLAHYREEVAEVFIDTVEKMKDVTDDALNVIHERLLETPEAFTTTALLETVTRLGDRAGFAPITKSVSLSGTVDSDAIARLKAKAQEAQNGKVIKKELVQMERTRVSEDLDIIECEGVRPSGAVQEASETEGLTGERAHVRATSGENASANT